MRTILSHSSVPHTFWPHALEHATYLLNILPTKVLNNSTPTLHLYHRLPTYEHLKVFGCLCFPLLPSTSIHKLADRSTPCVFLGYPSNHRGYKCFNLKTRQIIISRDVTFDEQIFPFSTPTPNPQIYEFLTNDPNPYVWSTSTTSPSNPSQPISPTYVASPDHPLPSLAEHTPPPSPGGPPASPGGQLTSPSQLASPTTLYPHSTPLSTTTTQNNIPSPLSPSATPPSPPPLPPQRTITTRSMTGVFKPKAPLNLHTSTPISPLPKTPTEALTNPDWKNAMVDEFQALIDNKTWELVPRTPSMNIVRSMWIFRHKKNANGSLERYKARLVCDGRSQQIGVDCGETFSPVVKPATIRTVLSLAISRSWPIHQLDVKNAFLHGNLGETVFMHQPMGFRDPNFPNHVCLLKKSLYGLKQAPRAWYQRFADYVPSMGFRHSQCDHSLFIFKEGNHMAFILLYVDDILLVTSTATLRTRFMSRLSAEFAMKDLGPISYFLGISVKYCPNSLFLSQEKYAMEILEQAGLAECNPVATPVDTQQKLSTKSGSLLADSTEYRRLAGALQYLTFTRPDIAYAVQQVCIHMHAPTTTHMNALKRVLRYIKGTLAFGLHISASPTTSLISYTDADWGGCPDTRRSTSGYCVYMGDNLLSWSSKRQPTLSRSSAEAEYRGVANVVSEVCWLRNLLLELHTPPTSATLVFCDNVSAIYLSGNPVQHQRTKHIEMDIHFVREKVAKGQIRVLHVPSRFQIADIFTKGLPRILFNDFRSSLNVRDPPVSTAGVY
ncbi:putative RNA-directed DNA polymerase [Helianthus anomalus]